MAATPPYSPPRRPFYLGGCLILLAVLLMISAILTVYFLFPGRINILVLGIDFALPRSTLSRSDTIILSTFVPAQPYVGMLSIPRDLWVSIPGVGENRINTAHFFAEAQQPGSGPTATLKTVQANFGVEVNYFIRINFEGFRDVFNAMGGVDIELEEPAAGYEPGKYHLTGNKALAFARQRYGSDDFYRMEHGQFIIKAAFQQMFSPAKWVRIPAVLNALSKAIDTNLPILLWPRLGMTLLRVGPSNITGRTITREMAIPFITSDGADVLQPQWDLINPLVFEMFAP